MLTPLPDDQLVLDFVNTLTRDGDSLATGTEAAQWWAGRTGRQVPGFSERDLEQLRQLRALLGGLFDDLTPAAVAGVNALLGEVRMAPSLGERGAVRIMLEFTDPSPLVEVSHRVVASLFALADGAGLSTVRSCAAPDCIVRFSSPNPRRLWCSSGGCGNRERVRRHYRRIQEAR